jgi:KTSC domain
MHQGSSYSPLVIGRWQGRVEQAFQACDKPWLEFRDGSIYQYRGVPEEIFRRLLNATSKGSFLNDEIAKFYEHVRLR